MKFPKSRTLTMLAGFAAAATGDVLLAVKGCPPGTAGFLWGVAAFAVAQVLWSLAHLREARPDGRVFFAVAVPLSVFVAVRLHPFFAPLGRFALSAYVIAGALNVATAYATHRRFYFLGACLLVLSDLLIGFRLLRLPGADLLIGPLYVASELAMLVSCFWPHERRFGVGRGEAAWTGAVTFALAGSLFVWAAFTFPGGDYNPFTRMLSALGRTEIRMVDNPWCQTLFMLGMAVSALGIARLASQLRLSSWGAVANAAGLVTIALVPENVNGNAHNFGCWIAAIGGGVMLFRWRRSAVSPFERWGWTLGLVVPVLLLGLSLAAHECDWIRFSPCVPTAQKLVIVSFAVWLLWLATRRRRSLLLLAAGAPVLIGCVLFWPFGRSVPPLPLADVPVAFATPEKAQFSADERAGLRWLEDVTEPHDDAAEKALWNIGGSQRGIFAKRYNIAFAGYAAFALGMRGDDDARRQAGRILGHCIRRMIEPDVWSYAVSKGYWGRKPWAPDPCYRENVMYTGHLLQLLAFYELLTGDRRYHRSGGGWDFVWRNGRRVHYDVEKLVGVTVEQMRKGPNGGISCEPGLMFFPCNNHPHIALGVFRRLGYGDWTQDAVRWERWALAHFLHPAFGGGLFNFLYHVRGNFFYPRAQNGLDGWSLLWYAAWASDPRVPTALWRQAAAKIDWNAVESAEDVRPSAGCTDPQPVSPAVTAVFLAAAARACGDPETADRLEKRVDALCLCRKDGRLFLDLNREWRIGATAIRLIAFAEANGFSFRDSLARRH